ncbi:hypothetical protein QMO17_34140, partial [Klebsiella pneumoniae]|nr:hypothetical protein [Klebsiella pneumoniae]
IQATGRRQQAAESVVEIPRHNGPEPRGVVNLWRASAQIIRVGCGSAAITSAEGIDALRAQTMADRKAADRHHSENEYE